jgi:hypothetical protein
MIPADLILQALNNRKTKIKHFLDSNRYSPDKDVEESYKTLEQQIALLEKIKETRNQHYLELYNKEYGPDLTMQDFDEQTTQPPLTHSGPRYVAIGIEGLLEAINKNQLVSVTVLDKKPGRTNTEPVILCLDSTISIGPHSLIQNVQEHIKCVHINVRNVNNAMLLALKQRLNKTGLKYEMHQYAFSFDNLVTGDL